ncbi:MAG: XcyI family restriction endonuclease [Gammaproteobacteria bacterium]|nr:XcyI family restriction endonuclease [Gammaproteobacteria bacterium]
MTQQDEAILRSRILSERIKQRTDISHRNTIENFNGNLSFEQFEDLGISSGALNYVADVGIGLKRVFAHPDLLHSHPEVSQYYRGIALLPQKQVQSLACNVSKWEDRSYKRQPTLEKCREVAKLYNAVISSVIEGTSNWTLENGYRNILATMGISLDGFMRNKIGQDAESLIKTRIASWLAEKGLTEKPAYGSVDIERDPTAFTLPSGTIMRFSSEPDIEITRGGRTIATIEIKGGTDPAGALERLGAMQKSFEETPRGCQNFLVAGVITSEMRSRLDNLGNVKAYQLDDLSCDGKPWNDFMQEVFHYTVRII